MSVEAARRDVRGQSVLGGGAMTLVRTARVFGVLALVAGLGAIAGLATGVLAILLMIVRDGGFGSGETPQLVALAGLFGAVIGVVLGPALALTLLRSVPLGRAALVPSLAGSVGVALVVALNIDTIAFYGVPVALACAAAVVLRVRAGRAAAADSHPAIQSSTTAS